MSVSIVTISAAALLMSSVCSLELTENVLIILSEDCIV